MCTATLTGSVRAVAVKAQPTPSLAISLLLAFNGQSRLPSDAFNWCVHYGNSHTGARNFSISNILLSDSDADVIPGSIRDSMLCLTPNILMALATLRKERSKRNTVDTVKVRNTITFLLMSVP